LNQTKVKVSVTGQAIKQFAGMSAQAFDQWKAQVTSSLKSATPALTALASKAKVTSASVIKSFAAQKKQFQTYGASLAKFSKLAIPDELKKQIIDMGLEGTKTMQAFSGMTKKELQKVSNDFQAGQDAIADTEGPLDNLNNDASTAADGVRDLDSDLKNLQSTAGNMQLNIHTNYTSSGKAPEEAAHGGVQKGGLTLVGERGPELMFIPAGSSVLPAHRTMRAMRRMSSLSGTPGREEGMNRARSSLRGANMPVSATRLTRNGSAGSMETALLGINEMTASLRKSVNLNLELDGVRVARTVAIRHKDMRVVAGGRGRGIYGR
jgi:hypothetical protein